jgi:hypothetical protein
LAYIGNTVDGGSYYNVNFAVGIRAPNKRDDALLVQWLLRHVYADHPLLTAPETKPLKIDGWIGAQTIRWIKTFQADMRRAGRACALDGRVDSARQPAGTVNKLPYTILWLNAIFQAANPAVYADPGSDPQAPLELLTTLATNTDAAGPFEEEPMRIPASGGI